jgi:hypothetical protein
MHCILNSKFKNYVDFRSRANTAMLLDLGHTLRGEHIQDLWGEVGNPKHNI